MLKFTVKGQASNKFMQYCSRTLWTTWSCSSKLSRITASNSVSFRLYTLMAPTKGNKRMKTEGSNEGCVALIYLSFVDWWAEFSQRIAGLFPPATDVDRFELYFKISRKTFNYICSLVWEPMSKSRNHKFNDGVVMSTYDKVAIAINRLKSGDPLVLIAKQINAQRITISQVTWSFVEALGENGLHHLQWPAAEEEIARIKAKFESIQGLPNCCGAIDITHIQLKACSSSKNAALRDKMNSQSTVFQAIVDPDMRFRDVICEYLGNMTGSSVLGSSSFFQLCDRGERLNGTKIKLSDGTELREYIVGDSGFPSREWLVTPFQGDKISEHEFDFNEQHFETWKVAPRALARLKEEWKFLQNVIWKPDVDKLPRMIRACCILYNIVIDMNDEMHHELSSSHEHDRGYLQEIDESGNNYTDLREKLSLYLSGKLELRVERASEYETG